MLRRPWETIEDVNSRFYEQLKYGRMWENYVMEVLPHAYPDYKVEHVQDILGFGVYKRGNNKHPDFRLTNRNDERERIYIDAKRKRGYTEIDPEYREYVTCDKSFLDSYNNIVKEDIAQGYNASAMILFWSERSGGAYLAPTQPDAWINFGANGYGPDPSGKYLLANLRREVEFEDFRNQIGRLYKGFEKWTQDNNDNNL